MRILHLDKLKEGMLEISPTFGAMTAEAAATCLTVMGHLPGATLKVEGDFETEFAIEWKQTIAKREKLTWNDLKEAGDFCEAEKIIALARSENPDGYEAVKLDDIEDAIRQAIAPPIAEK